MNALITARDPRPEPQDRQLPQNLDAEQALLGAILANNGVHERVADLLKPEHFFDPLHGRIFAAMGQLIREGKRADPIRLKNLFDQDAALADHGGAKYLVQLAQAVVTVINAEDYAAPIIDTAKRRQLIALAQTAIQEAFIFDPNSPIDAYMASVERRVADISTEGSTGDEAVRIDVLVDQAIADAAEIMRSGVQVTGITSGLAEVDKLVGGLHDSDLIILAGRPSMGKSALAQGMCMAAGRAGKVSAFFSMEMGARQIALREIAGDTGIAVQVQRRGAFGMFDLDAMKEFRRSIEGLPVYVDPTPALTVPMLRQKARYLKRRHGLDLIVLDYLQLMRGTNHRQNRTEELSEITRGLKSLAKELNIPVVALSQLSREVEKRDDKHPQLSDLRESGSIEQDADVVMFVYREEYYLERSKPRQGSMSANKYSEAMADWTAKMDAVEGLAEVMVAKQRHGPIDTAIVKFEGSRTRFSDRNTGENS